MSKKKKKKTKAAQTDHLINRELSWLEFNDRVLQVALSKETPLLERLKFLSIVSSNLDEFFMVRVGGLKDLVDAGRRPRCPAGMTPHQQLAEISKRAHAMVERQYRCMNEDIMPALGREDIIRHRFETISSEQERVARTFFEEEVFPQLTPVAVEEGQEFPRIAGLQVHVAVRLKKEAENRCEARFAIVPLPKSLPRFFQLPAHTGYHFVMLGDLVSHYLGTLFPGYQVIETSLFRLTRNADQKLQEDEANDLLSGMSDVLRERKSGSPVRLELDAYASRTLQRWLIHVFQLDRSQYVYSIDGPIDLRPFMSLSGDIDRPDLRFDSYNPQPVIEFEDEDNMWDVIRREDVMMHLPYQSFDPVVRFISEAADDPQVTAIKQTLYRTSSDSPIIAALERAALNGKQVAVLVELKARFDEAQNISWAQRLSESGCQVVYGVLGLKTHSKIAMVLRRESDGMRRYVHLSTGNYHDRTARIYEDLGLFTADPDIGTDAANFFNAVTGYSDAQEWRRLAIAPTVLRRRFEELIDREIAISSKNEPGLIMVKCNSLLDPEICEKLYEASCNHVRVKLCVRGICSLKPGVKGLSENIEVISIVGRYLEHSRIYYFQNGGREQVFLSSADWMPRNLDRRVEILFPVLHMKLIKRCISALDNCFADNLSSWQLQSDGRYIRRTPGKGEKVVNSQEFLMDLYAAQAKEAHDKKRDVFRPQGPGTAPGH